MRSIAVLMVLALLTGCAHDPVRDPGSTAGSVESSSSVQDNIQLPQTERYARKHDSGPEDMRRALARIEGLEPPVPKPEPLSRYGNGPSYEVRGKTYHVLPSASDYHATGTASWYGEKFQGHLTSSLEPYDMYKFTAAHKTLPLPSYVRVTNLDNGESIVVRVNDRGPFHGNRLIDLSWAAAVRLGIWKHGTGHVAVDGIDPRNGGEPRPAIGVPEMGNNTALYLQIGAYADRDNAAQMRQRLRGIGVAGVRVQQLQVNGKALSRVRIGPLKDDAALARVSQSLKRHGIPSVRVHVKPSSEE